MSVRERMKAWRKAHGVTLKRLSLESGVSETLLKMLENGEVTHPNIARQVARAYGLTEEEGWELMPVIHRPNSPEYNPTKYVEQDQERRHVVLPRNEDGQEYRCYLAERWSKKRRPSAKKGCE